MPPSGDQDIANDQNQLSYPRQWFNKIFFGTTTMQIQDNKSAADTSGNSKTSVRTTRSTSRHTKGQDVKASESSIQPVQGGNQDNLDEDDDALNRLIHHAARLPVEKKNKLLDAIYPDNQNHSGPSPATTKSGPVTAPKRGRSNSPHSTFLELHRNFRCDADKIWVEENDRLRSERNSLRDHLDSTQKQLHHERKHTEQQTAMLHAKIAELSHVHVRSVNGIGAGLDPISDQVFTEAFADYHVKTYQWCRMNLRQKKLLDYDKLHPFLQDLITARCSGARPTDISIARVADMILWYGVEDLGIDRYFPVAIPVEGDCGLWGAEWGFQRNDLPEHPQRIEYWRGYTACLAFQSTTFPIAIEHAVSDLVTTVVRHILGLVAEPHEVDFDALREIVHPIFITVAEMKCQRGLYELEPLQLGAEFNEDTMDDVETQEIERGVKMVVRVILSNGIVKRPYRESPEIVGRVRKPRVLICPAN